MNNITLVLNSILYNFYRRDDGEYMCLVTAFNDIDEVIDTYSIYYDDATAWKEAMADIIELVEA